MGCDKPKVAMVFGAGLGKRMRPLTDDRPKPLVEVCGKPIIEYTLDRLKASGIEKVVVNTHYKADQMERYLDAYKGVNIEYINEEELLDTGGGLLQALPLLGNDPFFVINGDIIWMEDKRHSLLDDLAKSWVVGSTKAILSLKNVKESIGYDGNGDFNLTKDGEIFINQGMQDNPYVFSGIHMFDPSLLDDQELKPFSLIETYKKYLNPDGTFQDVIKGIPMTDHSWLHIGTPEGVVLAEKYLNNL